MKMNLKVRVKNPYFWIGLGGVILTAMGISADMLTSWAAVWDALVNLVGNPFMLGSVVIAVLGVVLDPTTAGIGDSEQAMTYSKPKQ
jgi:phi LC3 family holin